MNVLLGIKKLNQICLIMQQKLIPKMEHVLMHLIRQQNLIWLVFKKKQIK